LPLLRVTVEPNVSPASRLRFLTFNVQASCPGFTKASRWVRLENYDTGESPELFLLEPEVSRIGIVLDSLGQPVPYATVCWVWLLRKGLYASKDWEETVTDSKGQFKWRAPAVFWQSILVAYCEGYSPGWAEVQLTDIESNRPIVVRLDQACTFRGTIVDENGKGVPEVSVKLFLKNPPLFWNSIQFLIARFLRPRFFSAKTDRNGRFRIEGLPPGRYVVRWLHKTLAASRAEDAEVVLPQVAPWQGKVLKGREIYGRMVTEDGEPVRNGRIFLRVHDPVIPSGWRPVGPTHIEYDGEGGFVAFGLEDEKHLLVARASGLQSEPS